MTEINVDATGAIVGRLASYVAKQAVLGYTVNVFNCEKAVISGDANLIRERYYHRIFKVGRPFKGPYRSRMPDRFVRWMIRGMLDHKHGRGHDAFQRVMCYIGVPVDFKSVKMVSPVKMALELPRLKYSTVGEICSSIGGKI